MGRWKFPLAMLAAAALLLWPETALNAGREAMRTWAASVAPALFPFLLLMPALTGAEAARAYEALLGRWMRPLLNLPGAAAPAIVVGMTAGAPAGALAAVLVCASAGMSRAEMERIVCCACGMGPAFLVTGIGASMLGSAADGRLLLRAQIASQLTLLIATRRVAPDVSLPPVEPSQGEQPVRAAVLGVLTVCGYMTLFSVAAALIARVVHSEIAGVAALCVLELPSGARALAALPLPRELRLMGIAALSGTGGLCIAAQNLSACGKNGLRAKKYFASRLAHAGLMTVYTALQLRWNTQTSRNLIQPLEISALVAAILAVPGLIFLKENPFLNKRNPTKNPEFPLEKAVKPQDIVEKSEKIPQYLVK